MSERDILQAPIFAMFRAGKQDIPAEGAHVARINNRLYDALDRLNVQSAQAGDPALMVSMLSVGDQIYEVLRGAQQSLDNCAVAVIRTAQDYVEQDENAKAEYRRLTTDPRTSSLPELTIPGHGLPPKLDPGGFAGKGATDHTPPQGPPAPTRIGRGDHDLAPPPAPGPTRMGRGDFEPHPPPSPGYIPPTRDPEAPEVDRDRRETTERQDKTDNPVVRPEDLTR